MESDEGQLLHLAYVHQFSGKMFLVSIDELTFLCFQLARELSHPPAAGCTEFQLLEDASLLDKSQPIIPVVLCMALNAAVLCLGMDFNKLSNHTHCWRNFEQLLDLIRHSLKTCMSPDFSRITLGISGEKSLTKIG